MDHSLFISDLHLCESRPHITQAFLHFLKNTAAHAQALYILGDLFEYWAGDDAIENDVLKMDGLKAALHGLSSLSKITPVFFMAGNRDFLIGDGFAKATGLTILSDPSLIELYGKPVLLSHGDALCTDDIAYQQFRKQVRGDVWKTQFLSQKLEARIATIETLRKQSEQAKSEKSMQIMDVNQEAVERLLKQFDYPPLFIHGHTHRPNSHQHTHGCTRWVLGDWYEQGSYLHLDKNGCKAQML